MESFRVQIRQAEDEIDRLVSELCEREKWITMARAELTRLRTRLEAAEATVAKRDTQIARLRAEGELAEGELAEIADAIQGLVGDRRAGVLSIALQAPDWHLVIAALRRVALQPGDLEGDDGE